MTTPKFTVDEFNHVTLPGPAAVFVRPEDLKEWGDAETRQMQENVRLEFLYPKFLLGVLALLITVVGGELLAAYTFDYHSYWLSYLEAAQTRNIIQPDTLLGLVVLSALAILWVINVLFIRPKQKRAKERLQQTRQVILNSCGCGDLTPHDVAIVGHWGWQSKLFVLVPGDPKSNLCISVGKILGKA